jgi:nitroreductase
MFTPGRTAFFLWSALQRSWPRRPGRDSSQDFVKTAPLNWSMSPTAKLPRRDRRDRRFHSGAHTGFISKNVYLFCASEGLSTVVRGLVDREAAARTMKLRPEQHITLAQTVGYPKK